ncbi:hypothetical protein R0Q57_05595 [Lactobacillus acidophilus]
MERRFFIKKSLNGWLLDRYVVKEAKKILKWLAKCTLQLSVDVKEIKKVLKIGYLSLLLQRGIYEKEFSSFGVL